MSKSVTVDSWRDFKDRIAKLRTSLLDDRRLSDRLLFRGQSDASWKLTTTLDRAGGQVMSFANYYRKMIVAQYQIESFTPSRWNTPDVPDIYRKLASYDYLSRRSGLEEPIYSYLTHLRHHGYPTPILDWSRSLYVASYFAFATARDVEHVSIYVLCEATVHSGSSKAPQLKLLGPYVRTHRRHYIQQCEYTLSVIFKDNEWQMTPHEQAIDVGDSLQFPHGEYPENFVICKFDLPASERLAVLKELDECNVNAFTLFGSEESLMQTLAFNQFELNRSS